jgi:hypothetical protein
MRGWSDFAQRVDQIRQDNGARWIATSSFATTAQLSYALKDRNVPVVQLNERLRYLHLGQPDPALLQTPALYVDLQRRERSDLLTALFRSVTPLSPVTRGPDAAPYATYAIKRLAEQQAPLPLASDVSR